MSDFISDFWSVYIGVLTALALVVCVALLMAMSKRKAPGAKPELHGHVWDEDLAEYNNPLPRWWIGLFYITIVFSVVYLVMYPGVCVDIEWSVRHRSEAGRHAIRSDVQSLSGARPRGRRHRRRSTRDRAASVSELLRTVSRLGRRRWHRLSELA